jgi:hypothetical protein
VDREHIDDQSVILRGRGSPGVVVHKTGGSDHLDGTVHQPGLEVRTRARVKGGSNFMHHDR